MTLARAFAPKNCIGLCLLDGESFDKKIQKYNQPYHGAFVRINIWVFARHLSAPIGCWVRKKEKERNNIRKLWHLLTLLAHFIYYFNHRWCFNSFTFYSFHKTLHERYFVTALSELSQTIINNIPVLTTHYFVPEKRWYLEMRQQKERKNISNIPHSVSSMV